MYDRRGLRGRLAAQVRWAVIIYSALFLVTWAVATGAALWRPELLATAERSR